MYLGKDDKPLGLVIIAQKDLDLLCSGNGVIALGIVTGLQLHFRTDFQILWRQVPRHFWNPCLCKSVSVLPKLHYKHGPNWSKLSKTELSGCLTLSENGRALQLKFNAPCRYSCMKEKQLLSATHSLFPWLLTSSLPLLSLLLLMQMSREQHQRPARAENRQHITASYFSDRLAAYLSSDHEHLWLHNREGEEAVGMEAWDCLLCFKRHSQRRKSSWKYVLHFFFYFPATEGCDSFSAPASHKSKTGDRGL